MIHDNMNIFHLIAHAQQVEDTMIKRKSRDSKNTRSFDGGSWEGRLDIQDKPRYKKRIYTNVL